MKNYFASNLKYLRQKHNLSQDELGAVINKTRSMVGYYENASSSPDLNILAALAKYFEMTMDDLAHRDLRNSGEPYKSSNGAFSYIVQEPQPEYGKSSSSEAYLKQIIHAKEETIKAKNDEIKVLQDLIAELREKIRVLSNPEDKKKR